MQGFVKRLEQLYTADKSRFDRLPSELLYGHVGYLYSLLFTNAYLPGAINKELLQEVRCGGYEVCFAMAD